MKRLSEADTRLYREQGYLLCRQPVFARERFDRLLTIFEALLAEKGEGNLDTPHFEHPEILDFLLAEEVLDLVEPLIGPDIGLWSSHFISKPPRTGKATPWHEDSGYWRGRFDRFDGIVTVWLAMEPVDAENGAMRVIPGTHLVDGYTYRPCSLEDNVFGEEIVDVDASQAVTFELAPNQCSLHDSRIVHGAPPNRSDRRRAGYTMRYFSQTMKLNLDHPSNRGFKLWHARGRNLHDNPTVN